MFNQSSTAFLVLFMPAILSCQQKSEPLATLQAFLHQKLTASCELVQPVILVEAKGYDSLSVGDATDDIYSLELGKGDFVSITGNVPKRVLKSAKKSGFDIRPDAPAISGQSQKPFISGSSCPDTQQALSDAAHQRMDRRTALLSTLYKLRFDISPPTFLRNATSSAPPPPSGEKPRVRSGTVVLAATIDVLGKVSALKVVRKLDPVLDQRALYEVSQWQFSPARIKGLPVPSQIEVTLNFNLY